jgi:hypothetical protein
MTQDDIFEFVLLCMCTALGIVAGLYLAVALFQYCPSNVKQEITNQFHQFDGK